jgi:serine/threonine protein kinase
LLNWSLDETGKFKVEHVVLSDLDCALKLEGEKLLDHRIGNVMWRSPEGQMGKGIGKPSEVFSFGLLVNEPAPPPPQKEFLAKHGNQCLYTVTGVETLHPDFQQLKEEGTEPEHVILYKLLSMFGPAPPELITHVNNGYWGELLTALSRVVEEEDPRVRFEQWEETEFPNLNPETKRMILRMTNLDPNKRATMDQVLEDRWWD